MKKITKVYEERPMCYHQWEWDDHEFDQNKGVITTYFLNCVCVKCGVQGGSDSDPSCMWCGEYPCNCCQKCHEAGACHTPSGEFLCTCAEVKT